MKKAIALAFILILSQSFAQTGFLKVDQNLKLNKLKEGKNSYLVYTERTNGRVLDISLWEREVKFELLNGKEVIIIAQKWQNQDAKRTKTLYSVNRKSDFYPIYHKRIKGKGIVEAFDFNSDKIRGTDSIPNNAKKGFSQKLDTPTFNWELDLETLQMFPFEEEKDFRIHFYHPGSKRKPADYVYKFLGIENIKVAQNLLLKCYKVRLDHDVNSYTEFWISVDTREVVKVVDYSEHIRRRKIKLWH